LFPRSEEGKVGSKRIAHEEYSAAIIKSLIADVMKAHRSSNELGLDATTVASFIDDVPADGKVAVFKDVISGTMDADRMDYLLRDAHHCGVRYGQYDLERMINTVGICEDDEDEGSLQVGVNKDGVHAAEGLVIARFMMFTQVYMHKTRSIYDYHFEHCMKDLLAINGGTFPGPRSSQSLGEFMKWDDWRVLGQLSAGAGGEHGDIIRNREHHRMVYESEETFEGEGSLERAIRKFEKLKNATKEFGVVGIEVSKSWYSQKLGADILVRPQDGNKSVGTRLSQVSNVVNSLKPVNQLRLYAPLKFVDSAQRCIENILKGGK
jgi:uncharacterized protein